MNDKGYFLISMTKSDIRILSSVIAIKKKVCDISRRRKFGCSRKISR